WRLVAVGVLRRFFFQAEDGIRDFHVTGVQTCALPICMEYAKGKFSVVSGSSRLELDGEFYVNGDVPDPEEPISDDDPRTEEYTGDTEEYEVRDTLSFVFATTERKASSTSARPDSALPT